MFNICLNQGSALSPLLFIMAMELISREQTGTIRSAVLVEGDISCRKQVRANAPKKVEGVTIYGNISICNKNKQDLSRLPTKEKYLVYRQSNIFVSETRPSEIFFSFVILYIFTLP